MLTILNLTCYKMSVYVISPYPNLTVFGVDPYNMTYIMQLSVLVINVQHRDFFWMSIRKILQLSKRSPKKKFLGSFLNLFVLSESFFIFSGKQLKIFIPARYTPFWYLINLVCGRKRLDLLLEFFVWMSEFGVNISMFLTTNSASDNMY